MKKSRNGVSVFVAHSVDKYGLRYKRTLTTEVATCESFKSGFTALIDGRPWTLNWTEVNGLVAETMDCDAHEKWRRQRLQTLNGMGIGFSATNGNVSLRIRQSVIGKISFMPPRLTAEVGEMCCARPKAITSLRAMIPYPSKLRSVWFPYYFASKIHGVNDIDQWVCSCVDVGSALNLFNGIRFIHDDVGYLVYFTGPTNGSNPCYLVVEAFGRCGYDKFQAAVRRAISMIGFFTGTYPYGPLFVFNAKTSTLIAFNGCVISASSARYMMLSLNAYDYYANDDLRPNIGNEIEPKLKPVLRSHIERLLDLLDDQAFGDFYHTFQMLTTSMGFMPVSTRLVCYAACLEMGRRWVDCLRKADGGGYSDKKGSLLTRTVRRKLLSTINEMLGDSSLDTSEVAVVKKKLSGVFSAPNQTSLEQAFSHFGLGLPATDRKLLGLRNKILHGENILKTWFDPRGPSKRHIEECERYCFGYHALIWRMIMSAIGYNGQYRDVVKIDRLFRQQKSNKSRPLVRRVKGRRSQSQSSSVK